MPKSQMAQVRALIQRNNLMLGWLGKLRRQNHHVLQPTSYFPPTTHQKKQPTNAVYAIAFSSITTEKKIMVNHPKHFKKSTSKTTYNFRMVLNDKIIKAT